ncbi:MAG: hypothetical protein JRI36_05475, partial [Deltaproteobacteria bacterium]|nr:hypothetical protein [Deltaproteobacteria bacterium]
MRKEFVGTAEGVAIVEQFAKKFRADGIACVAESIALWLRHAKEQGARFPTLWLPKRDKVLKCLDKLNQIRAAEVADLDTLPTIVIPPPGEPLPEVPKGFFPLCVRPTAGGVEPPFKVKLVVDLGGIRKLISRLNIFKMPLVAQPFRNLPNLVVHGARRPSGEVLGLKAFLVGRKFEGVTLTLDQFPLPEPLREGCVRFLHEMDLTGPFHFEFLWDSKRGKAYFLEINNRFGGTTAKVFACGYEEPALALKAYGVHVDPGRGLERRTVSSKQALLKYMYYALTDRLTPLDYPDEPKAKRVAKAL